VTYSYSQLAHYLSCPRRYRHRYLDGWQEKDSRASMLFGRAFEQALGAYFRREDAAVAFYREWATYQKQPLHYGERDTWDRMLEQALLLLDRFSQDDRVRVLQPRKNLQIKFVRPLAAGNDFVAYVDAIGKLDGTGCLLEWKTTSSRYPEQPDGLLGLDPSYSATPGSAASRKWPRSYSCASAWSRSSTCAPGSRTNNDVSSVIWFRKPSARSSQPSFCRTAASAFPRTPAAPVLTWDCVWGNRH
jgi:hypothetical protein